jgi:microcystin-dependent protein
MSEAYIGEIRAFGFNFAPYNWMFCNGQLLPISSYTALFSILGTTYGGNGTTNFALPNLQGQIPMHWGSTPSGGAPQTVIGEVQGTPNVTLQIGQLPQHQHTISSATAVSAERSPTPTSTSFLADAKGGLPYQNPQVTTNAPFSPKAITQIGGSVPHDNMSPYLVLNFCICFNGYFPSRS